MSIESALDKIPAHSGLGELVLDSMNRKGHIKIYRPCLYEWSKEQKDEYMLLNERCIFGWCEYGEEPIYGVMALIRGDEEE